MLGGVNAYTDAQTEAPSYQLLTILPLNPGESAFFCAAVSQRAWEQIVNAELGR